MSCWYEQHESFEDNCKNLGTFTQKLFKSGDASDFTVICKDKEWKLHKVVLKRSQFFAGAIDHGFSESQTSSVDMADDDPDAVEILLKHLYCYEYPYHDDERFSRDITVYFLARKYLLSELESEAQLSAVSALISRTHSQHKEAIKTVTAQLSHKNTLREEIIKAAAAYLDCNLAISPDSSITDEEEFQELVEECPQFAIDVYRYLLKQKKEQIIEQEQG